MIAGERIGVFSADLSHKSMVNFRLQIHNCSENSIKCIRLASNS